MNTSFLRLSLLFLISLYLIPGYGQHSEDQINLFTGSTEQIPITQSEIASKDPYVNKAAFNCDCKTDFFTVDTAGVIKKWRLSNNVITGGTVVLTGAYVGGLSFVGKDEASRTFYCGNSPSNSLRYYDPSITAWKFENTPFTHAINNGGYKEDQYYMRGYNSHALYHYVGGTFTQVPTGPIQITQFDVAVDTLGRAWVFTGHSGLVTTELRVYEPTGLVNSYSISLPISRATYGAFFVDGQLYIAGTTQGMGEIVPINISGTTASAGPVISFPNEVFGDVADCQCIPPTTAHCPDLSPVMRIIPSNIAGISPIEFAVEVTEINNVDTDGSNIVVRMISDQRLTFVWDVGLTTAANLPVQNADWNYLGDNGLFHSWTYNGLNQIIQGGATSSLGFQGFYDPQVTSGSTTFTATVVPFSGGECNNLTNNSNSETLVYFD